MGRHTSGTPIYSMQNVRVCGTCEQGVSMVLECQHGIVFLWDKASVSTDLWFYTPGNLILAFLKS